MGTKVKKCLKMESNKDVFKKEFKSAFSKEQLNADTLKDFSQFVGGLKEEGDDDQKQPKKNLKSKKKSENKEATGSGSSGAYSGPLFSGEEPVNEEFEKVEATEATGTGSSGAYETPAMWAKSTKKKDWGPSRKPQYKGGTFVSVKKKCTKFPYCNQGDIKALNLYKNESVKEAITNVANKLNITETTVKAILEYEMEKISKRTK